MKEIEKYVVEDDVKLVKRMLTKELEVLDSSVKDYAYWTDTYDFMDNMNEEYIADSISNQGFINVGIDYMVFISTDSSIYYIKGVNRKDATLLEITEDFTDSIGELAISHLSQGGKISGFHRIGSSLYLLASRPILDSDMKGPQRGTLLFLKPLDAEFLAGIKNLLKIEFRISDYNFINDSLPNTDVAVLLDKGILINTVSGVTNGYLLLDDLEDNPLAVVFYSLRSNSGAAAQRFVIVLLEVSLLIYFTTVVLSLLFIDRVYISPVGKLVTEVDKIRTKKITSQRIFVKLPGEMGKLVKTINTLLESLDQFDKKMVEVNQELETKAKELEENSHELERLNRHMVGREIRMAELKEELEDWKYKANNKNDIS